MSEFVVVYDYRTGGVWGIVRAESALEIATEFPELIVMESRPEWMSPEEEESIRSEGVFDLNEPSTYPTWLSAIIQDRNN